MDWGQLIKKKRERKRRKSFEPFSFPPFLKPKKKKKKERVKTRPGDIAMNLCIYTFDNALVGTKSPSVLNNYIDQDIKKNIFVVLFDSNV